MNIKFIILLYNLISFLQAAILSINDVPIPKEGESLAGIPNWELKPSGYSAGDFVKYNGNVFKADYWAKNEPGKNPKPAEGWSLYQ